MASLDTQRDDLIARIKAVFPKNPPGKWKYEFKVSSREDFEGRKLEESLGGKRWESVIDIQMLVPFFTDVDYLFAFMSKAFRYYLPAFLVALLKESRSVDNGYRWFFENFWEIRNKFSLEELEIVLAVLNCQREHMDNDDWDVDQLETGILQLMYYLEERQK